MELSGQAHRRDSGAIAKAFYIARSGRPGPVVVDITKDAQCGTAPFSYEKVASIRSYVPASVPSEERIDEAARLIDAAQRPLAMIGQGVILSGGEAELRAFLDKSGMPAASTLLGLSALPTRLAAVRRHAGHARPTTVPTSKTGTATCSSPWACASTTA